MGDKCGGNFKILEKHGGIKDCTNCTLPHEPDYYDTIVSKLREAKKS